jgi:hypothetical protein
MTGKDTKSSDRRWHAVSVKPGGGACNAAVSGKNRRWLSREAPLLPLPGCTRPDACQCTYNHHDDRRPQPAGRGHERLQPGPRVANERRSRKTRRDT